MEDMRISNFDCVVLIMGYDIMTVTTKVTIIRQDYKNSSGDEIENVNFFTTTSYMYRPAPTPIEPTS